MTEEALGFLTDLVPVGVGEAFFIGIGEEDDLTAFQRKEFGRREFVHPTGGHPEIVSVDLGHDDGGLFGLDYGDRPVISTVVERSLDKLGMTFV